MDLNYKDQTQDVKENLKVGKKSLKETVVAMNGQEIVVQVEGKLQDQKLLPNSSKISPPLEFPKSNSNLGHDEDDFNVSDNVAVKKEELEEDDSSDSACTKCIGRVHAGIHSCFSRNSRILKNIFLVFLAVGYSVYFGFAIWFNRPRLHILIGLTIFTCSIMVLLFISRRFGTKIGAIFCTPIRRISSTKGCVFLKWTMYGLVLAGLIAFVVIDIGLDVKRLTSLGGMVVFLVLGYLTSKYPAKVKWRPVFWGLGLQLTLGVLILRWTPGFRFFKFLGDQVRQFLEFAEKGSAFVFGSETYLEHPMAFQVFPIIIYFSAVINILYYWGVMQFVVCKIAWLMQFTMGTTAIESLNAACNIFIGMAESCIIMKPFLYKLTKSELHAVMTGGFATVAGSYIALLIQVGASPEHLISAAIMSAPAALAMAKLSYPEIEVSHTKTEDDVQMEKAPEHNIIQAASNGAIAAVKVVASVAANLIAIIGLIEFLNNVLKYFGEMVGVEDFSFETICSVIFWPLAVIMGVEIQDASKVASLLGTKVFVDEYISFNRLVEMTKLDEIADRSKVLATYACCGFGSIAAMGMYIGALTTVAPKRKTDISQVALRALFNGNIAGFLTACIAGILYDGESFRSFMIDLTPVIINSTSVNYTSVSA